MDTKSITAEEWYQAGMELSKTGSTSLASKVGEGLTPAVAFYRAAKADPSMCKAWNGLSVNIPRLGEVVVDGDSLNSTLCSTRAIEAAKAATPPPTKEELAKYWLNLGASFPTSGECSAMVDGERVDAIGCYVNSIAHAAGESQAWSNLAQVLLEGNKKTVEVPVEGTRKSFDAAAAALHSLELSPSNHLGWYFLGRSLADQPGLVEVVAPGFPSGTEPRRYNAADCFLLAAKLRPNDPVCWGTLLDCMEAERITTLKDGDQSLTIEAVLTMALTHLPMEPELWNFAVDTFETPTETLRLPKVDPATGTVGEVAPQTAQMCARMVILTGEVALKQAQCPLTARFVATSWCHLADLEPVFPFNVGDHIGVTRIECFRQALSICPNYGQAWGQLGEELAKGRLTVKLLNGEDVDSAECYLRAVSRWAMLPGLPRAGLAESWVRLAAFMTADSVQINGRRFTQLDCLLEALRVNTRCQQAWHVLGMLLRNTKRTLELPLPGADGKDEWKPTVATATLCYVREVQINPADPTGWEALGKSLTNGRTVSFVFGEAERTFTATECLNLAHDLSNIESDDQHLETEGSQPNAQAPKLGADGAAEEGGWSDASSDGTPAPGRGTGNRAPAAGRAARTSKRPHNKKKGKG